MTRALRRLWQVARSLPTTPLRHYRAKLAEEGLNPSAPPATEAERLTRVRIGQATFRAALMYYWDGTCPLTGITEPALLRAIHIVPWAACTSDAQRLDVHNGPLLSALLDAAFDSGLVAFDNEGSPVVSTKLTLDAKVALALASAGRVRLTERHHEALVWHKENRFTK